MGGAGPRKSSAFMRRASAGRSQFKRQMGRNRGLAMNLRTGGFAGRYSYGLKGTSPEMKYEDIYTAPAVTSSTGAIGGTLVGIIQQGTGESQRVGRKIVLRKVLCRGAVNLDGTGLNDASDVVRIMLVKDKQTNGAVAAVTDILEDDQVLSFNKLENKGRFTILKEVIVEVNSTAAAYDGTNVVHNIGTKYFSFFHECNIPIEYSGNGGTVADLTTNNVFLVAISISGAAYLTTNVRVRYFDG